MECAKELAKSALETLLKTIERFPREESEVANPIDLLIYYDEAHTLAEDVHQTRPRPVLSLPEAKTSRYDQLSEVLTTFDPGLDRLDAVARRWRN